MKSMPPSTHYFAHLHTGVSNSSGNTSQNFCRGHIGREFCTELTDDREMAPMPVAGSGF